MKILPWPPSNKVMAMIFCCKTVWLNMPQRIHPENNTSVNLVPPKEWFFESIFQSMYEFCQLDHSITQRAILLLWKSNWIMCKPRLQSLPSYGTATGNPTVPPPDYQSDNPTDIFVGTQNPSEEMAESHDHNQDHENSPAISTNLCECKSSVWWFNFCCGIFCHSCVGKVTDSKVHGSVKFYFVWMWSGFISLVFGVLLLCGIFVYNGSTTGIIIAGISGGILCIDYILRARINYRMRRHFLENQLEKGNYPNDEEKWKSCILAFFCAPCMFGQINVAQL